ncbi:phenylalanine ammonia-lyase [Aspergillus terreus]|uniref:Phenylalanine ammonia-lyase n=1 Tax=Aspergillus terreus TaxID=33178 RepID=A0A5M3YSP5_ASPTE|nr:hypothetical protein ATETN484_0002040000 [Aspergillus terreus]GFF15256.1 phenylalanine ammonia-lyase [Aspergillus terreus]
MGYTEFVLASCRRLHEIMQQYHTVTVDGDSLDLSAIVAVAKHGTRPAITDDKEVLGKMKACVDLLNTKLAEGSIIYGVNTGFGGSADVRTNDYEALQKALIQHHNAAVVLPSERGLPSTRVLDSLKKHSMPTPVVRAAMLTRCNSLIRGHSAVREEVIRHIITLIAHDLTPVVPLRGSISASGDLTPLAYIAGVLEGNPDIAVECGKTHQIIPANEALARANLRPLDFQPKEGLGLLNGTAFSCGAGSLVVFEANQLALLAQITTAMCTEAMLGTRRNFHPFIADVRPHPGQTEAARNIFAFLANSKLATNLPPEEVGLAQDRYAIRTSSQWIGPQLESLKHASEQIQCELNSTTDNPLFDVASKEIHHCGNFQALSVTSAMEKTMSAMQTLGKMVFSQCSEILNPMLNKGLPPNLCADDPSRSFAFKGVDINMASYISELSYIAHPVSNHVHSAEMHNQGINSLAFIAGRYAADSVEILSLMLATHVYVLCQALDLRVMQLEFEKEAKKEFAEITERTTRSLLREDEFPMITSNLWETLMAHWGSHTTCNLADRANMAANETLGVLFRHLGQVSYDVVDATKIMQAWETEVRTMLIKQYDQTRAVFFESQTTPNYLCGASQKLYSFVRETLEVPMHKGLVDHPTYTTSNGQRGEKAIGTHIGTVYAALRQGDFMDVLVSCWGQGIVNGHNGACG